MSSGSFPYADILARAASSKAETASFLRGLRRKRGLSLENLFAEAEELAFEDVDCRLCGECCRSLGPRLADADVRRLARRERMRPGDFQAAYLAVDEDGDSVFGALPCPFFGGDGLCSVYEDRPRACRDYPHLSKGMRRAGLDEVARNAAVCPAVALAVERLKDRLR